MISKVQKCNGFGTRYDVRIISQHWACKGEVAVIQCSCIAQFAFSRIKVEPEQ
jgi:hypothetical protein